MSIRKSSLTLSANQTGNLGKELAKVVLKKPSSNRAFIIALKGDLGGGKTTFLQGFAKGLKIKEKILSPTFVLLKRFKIKDLRFKNFYHIDCYRIENPKEILELGFEEITANPENIVAIEWADKIKKILPRNTLWLKFEFRGKNKRKIVVE